MQVFKNAWFTRFARKERISSDDLLDAVNRVSQGLFDADLGSGVYKQRIARPGQGRSKGYRSILLFRKDERCFFVYGYAKSELENITAQEEIQFRLMARHVLNLSQDQLALLMANGQFEETMEALHEVGAVGRQTMREFDASCLTPIEPLAPEAIKALRLREHISQPVFARYLNVSKNLVSDWERGIKKPGGPALRLLTVIQHKGLLAIA
eukprot:gene29179-36184_t